MGKRASDFFPELETDIARWNLDEACLVVGRQVENAYNKGEDPWKDSGLPTRSTKPGLYKSAKQAFRKAIKKVKFNAKGIW